MGKFYNGNDGTLIAINDAMEALETEANGHAVTQRQKVRMGDLIRQMTALIGSPKATNAAVRQVLEARLDDLLEIAPGGCRPGMRVLPNIDDIRPKQNSWSLEFTPPNYMINGGVANGPYVYVVMTSRPWEVRVGVRANGGHTAISRGANVYYAGEMLFHQGQLTYWDNNSGHYIPPTPLHDQVKHLLPAAKFRERPL